MSGAMLFLLGFTSITAVYEIAVTGKRTKSERIQKKTESMSRNKKK
ncbi:MAG: hypothetical protein HFI75_14625 [Lachnospiraceae bacterium]|nr:hypothetical protein [Lachnospiraceae bacterium]